MGDLKKLGPKGEDFALALLRRRGHRLLERNFRCPQGELDLITWHKRILVFTEVRARRPNAYQHPVESIGPEKQRRLVRAAQWYLAKRAQKKAPPICRFDVVWLVVEDEKVTESGVIEGAFSA